MSNPAHDSTGQTRFTLAIVGRPNVGKSTLFNRLAGKRLAIVDNTPGVTRDWRAAPAWLAGLELTILDTAGLEDGDVDALESRMSRQTMQAVEAANAVLFVYDARVGITPVDAHFADLLRSLDIPVLIAGNKCESAASDAGLLEGFTLGLGEPIGLSAEQGTGLAELYDAVAPLLAAYNLNRIKPAPPEPRLRQRELEEGEEEDESEIIPEETLGTAEKPIRLAIVGRPNVGKSTLLNTILGEERMLTGPEAGITRDAVTVPYEHAGAHFQLVDTAGLRKKARVVEKLEKASTEATLRAIRLAQVVVLVIESIALLDRQDLHIARLIEAEGRALILAVNKWDLVEDRQAVLAKLRDKLETGLGNLRGVPVVTLSALQGHGVKRLFDAVLAIVPVWSSRISTSKLNRWLGDMVSAHPAPLANGRPNRMRYMTQIKSRPPTFAVWATSPEDVPETYGRYLVNGLRQTFDVQGVPVRLVYRKSKNPYVDND